MNELSPYHASIVKYYEDTWIDYRVLWLNRKNRSVHFGYYDEGIKKHNAALENLNRVMADKVYIRPGDLVLDAGCGQGGSSAWLAQNRDVIVNGITLVPQQVEIANKDAVKKGLQEKLNFSVGNYCYTQFPENHFSVVWACESLCHAQQKRQFYAEAMRVLRPGGRLVVAEYIRKERPLTIDGEKQLKDWLDRWSIEDIDTWEEHLQNMENAGFINIDMENCSANVRPSLRHLHSMSKKLLPLGKLLLKVGLRTHVNHGNHLGSINQYIAFEHGLWYYGIFSAVKPGKT